METPFISLQLVLKIENVGESILLSQCNTVAETHKFNSTDNTADRNRNKKEKNEKFQKLCENFTTERKDFKKEN